jgi:lipoic acid synthetase
MRTKSGFMVGLGETEQEIFETIDDLASVNVEIITIGQYLQPTSGHLEIVNFITPEKFEQYRKYAVSKGFRHVESSPLVRSSYHAEKHIH